MTGPRQCHVVLSSLGPRQGVAADGWGEGSRHMTVEDPLPLGAAMLGTDFRSLARMVSALWSRLPRQPDTRSAPRAPQPSRTLPHTGQAAASGARVLSHPRREGEWRRGVGSLGRNIREVRPAHPPGGGERGGRPAPLGGGLLPLCATPQLGAWCNRQWLRPPGTCSCERKIRLRSPWTEETPGRRRP